MSQIIVFFITMFSAMLPLVEIRGALPLGMSSVWGDGALSSTFAWIACILGGTIVCFIAVAIFIYLRKTLERFKLFKDVFAKTDAVVLKFANKSKDFKFKKRHKKIKEETKDKTITFQNKSETKPTKNGEWKKFMLVLVFCALPIPFSGVWTAAGLCSILKLSYLKSVLALGIANIITGMFIYLFCTILAEYIDVVLVILILIMTFVLIYKSVAILVEKRNIKKEEQS